MGMATVLAPEERSEYFMTFMNIKVWSNPSLPRGVIAFRNAKGEIIGIMRDVAEVYVGSDHSRTIGSGN